MLLLPCIVPNGEDEGNEVEKLVVWEDAALVRREREKEEEGREVWAGTSLGGLRIMEGYGNKLSRVR